MNTMNFLYFDTSAGISGDMILGALLDLGVSADRFREQISKLKLPVKIEVHDVQRSSLRGLKVDVHVQHSHHVHRRWADIERLISESSFSASVQKKSLDIFKRLFTAEAHVHGKEFHTTHLHEAGADDAIVDIVGSCFLIEALDAKTLAAAPMNLGQGWVKAAHGTLPVPPPAVAELLKGIPVYAAWAAEELVTPTGAAIISTLAERFVPFPEIMYDRIGYGAGGRDIKDFPNILRVFMGREDNFEPEKQIHQIEANIDDANPQVLAYLFEQALAAGALDIYLTPVVMKKNRLATKLTVLAETATIDGLVETIFRETTSIGVRVFPVGRRVLDRKMETVEVLGEPVGIKVAFLNGAPVNIQPEFRDCQRLAEKQNLPVKHVIDLAVRSYSERNR